MAPTSSSSNTNRYLADTPTSSVSSATTTNTLSGKPSSTKHTKQSPSVILGEHGGVKTMIWTDSSYYSQAQAQAQAHAAATVASERSAMAAANIIKNSVSSQPIQCPPRLIKLEPGIAVQAVQAAHAAKAKMQLDADQQLKMSSAVDGLLSLSSIPPQHRRIPTPSNVPHPPTSTSLQQLQQHPHHQQQQLAQHSPHPHSPSMQQSPRIIIPGSQHGPSQPNIMSRNNSPSISPMIRHNGPITSSVTPTPFQTFCNTPPSPNTHPTSLPINVPVNENNKRRSPMNMERLWAGDQSQLPAHCQENQV
jgi:hypothetical protein